MRPCVTSRSGTRWGRVVNDRLGQLAARIRTELTDLLLRAELSAFADFLDDRANTAAGNE